MRFARVGTIRLNILPGFVRGSPATQTAENRTRMRITNDDGRIDDLPTYVGNNRAAETRRADVHEQLGPN